MASRTQVALAIHKSQLDIARERGFDLSTLDPFPETIAFVQSLSDEHVEELAKEYGVGG